MAATYFIDFLERPYGNAWVVSQTEEFTTEMAVMDRLFSAIKQAENSREPIKIIARRNKLKIASFTLSYGR
jgi:hypothetical protein